MAAARLDAIYRYDLVLTILDMLQPEWGEISQQRKDSCYQDHCHVNSVIARTIDAVQDEVVEPLSPALDLADRVLGPFDEWMLSRPANHPMAR